MLPSDATEAGFWDAIAEAPQDEVPRLKFADWLEENNDPRGPLFRERLYWPHLNVVARLVDMFCEEEQSNPRAVIADGLIVVGLSCLEAILGTVLKRSPAHFLTLARECSPIRMRCWPNLPSRWQNRVHISCQKRCWMRK